MGEHTAPFEGPREEGSTGDFRVLACALAQQEVNQQVFLDKGMNTGTFLGRHFLERRNQFINDFLEMLIQHEERHLTLLGE